MMCCGLGDGYSQCGSRCGAGVEDRAMRRGAAHVGRRLRGRGETYHICLISPRGGGGLTCWETCPDLCVEK